MKRAIKFIEEYFLAISLAVMVFINFGNVLSRYVLHASWAFTEELLVILFVWNTMLASAVAFKYGAHLGLSVLTDLLPQKYQKYVVLLGALTTIVLMAILARYGIDMVANQIRYNQRTSSLNLPGWVAGISIIVGAFAIILRVIGATYSTLTTKVKVNLQKGGE